MKIKMLNRKKILLFIVSLMSTSFGMPIGNKTIDNAIEPSTDSNFDLVPTKENVIEPTANTNDDLVPTKESVVEPETGTYSDLIQTNENGMEPTTNTKDNLAPTNENVMESTPNKNDDVVSTNENVISTNNHNEKESTNNHNDNESTKNHNDNQSTNNHNDDTAPKNENSIQQENKPKIDDNFLKSFLIKSGFVNASDVTDDHESLSQNLADGIKRFQAFVGLKKTCILDDDTIAYILKPKCGVQLSEIKPIDGKGYELEGSKWSKQKLTWFVENNYSRNISPQEVRELMRQSFQKWSDVTNIEFEELSSSDPRTADIRISFQKPEHSSKDNHIFSSDEYAHAFYPKNNIENDGDCHFNDDKDFTTDSSKASGGKVYFLALAIHELGHSLGLHHSSLKGTIMFPYYEDVGADLTPYDIKGIQAIYGSKVVPAKNNTFDKIYRPKVDCPSTVDALVSIDEGNTTRTLIFDKYKFYVLNPSDYGIDEGPISVDSKFKGIKFVDAVFTREDRLHFFFHGDSFSVFKNYSMQTFSRKISDGFQLEKGFSDVDAALSNGCDIYLFKGELYWKFSSVLFTMDFQLIKGYPRKIANDWKGLPSPINGAFTWNRKIFFFKGSDYYRVRSPHNTNITKFKVEYGYPMKVSDSFLKCASQSSKGVLSSYFLVFISLWLTVWSCIH